MTVRFVQSVFVEYYDPTIEDAYRKPCTIDRSPCVLEILDTAGTEQFAAMRDLYVRGGEAFLLVYSITSPETFAELEELRDQIVQSKGTADVPIVVVGNKADLEADRRISPEEGEALADSWGALFMETSARTGYQVEDMFYGAVREVRLSEECSPARGKRERRRRRCCLM